MPLVLIAFGAVLIAAAYRGTEHELAAQLASDFGSGGSFLAWAGAIAALGALGYVPALRTLSNMLMALVIVVLVLHNGGLFTQLAAIVDNPPPASPGVPLAAYSSGSGGTSGSGGGGSGGGTGGLGGSLATPLDLAASISMGG